MNFKDFLIAILGIAVLSAFGFTLYDHSRPENVAARQEEELECRKPVKVAETPDGVELWRYQTKCNANKENVVYFSKFGTNRTYTVRHGKTSTTIKKTVPSTGE